MSDWQNQQVVFVCILITFLLTRKWHRAIIIIIRKVLLLLFICVYSHFNSIFPTSTKKLLKHLRMKLLQYLAVSICFMWQSHSMFDHAFWSIWLSKRLLVMSVKYAWWDLSEYWPKCLCALISFVIFIICAPTHCSTQNICSHCREASFFKTNIYRYLYYIQYK